MSSRALATSQQMYKSSSPGQADLAKLLLHILEFYAKFPLKIFQTSSSTDQDGEVELFLAQSIKYCFQKCIRHTRYIHSFIYFHRDPLQQIPSFFHFSWWFNSEKFQTSGSSCRSQEDSDPMHSETCSWWSFL